MSKEKALNFRIIIHPVQLDWETEGGIRKYGSDDEYEIAQRAVDKGRVISIGEASFKPERFGKVEIKEGDLVRFKKYAGHMYRDVDHLGKPLTDWFVVMNDDDVLTILEEA
uniref:Co-chaperonin GroES n=1 Tax=uncultured virus TaxID=340016 RepID=A0A221S3J5_9VIRU|nr:co-chaperonin GroES [uncultured virus]